MGFKVLKTEDHVNADGEGFVVDYLDNGKIRVSYFINGHFREEIIVPPLAQGS